MTPGSFIVKGGGIFRSIECASDGFIEDFYQPILNQLSSLLNEYSVEELVQLIAVSKQLDTVNFEKKMFLTQDDVDKLKELEPSPRTEDDEFWAILETLPANIEEWSENDCEDLHIEMCGSPSSLSFNLKAQMLSGLFLQFGSPFDDEIPSEAELAEIFGDEELGSIIDFDEQTFTYREWDVAVVLTFDEIRESPADIQALYEELEEG